MRELLDRGGILITANARAARELDRRFAQGQQALGIEAWPTARILDLHSWLNEQWELLLLTGTEGRLLLNDVQEHAIWQRILKPQLDGRSLIEPARLAAQAQEAYALLAAYGALERIHDRRWLLEPGTEPELFRNWARRFEDECSRRRWLPRCQLIDAVSHGLRWGLIHPPSEIGWLGFDRETPAERDLMTTLRAAGTALQTLTSAAALHAAPVCYQAHSETEEAAACATWIRAQLKAQPQARIGILMPDVAGRRAQIEREFYRRLSPAAFPITAGATPSLPFEFSLGQPLARVPLVHAALLLLRWLQRPFTQVEVSWLLLSSTLDAIHGDAAREAMARWDAQLRDASCTPPEVSLESWLRQRRGSHEAITSLHNDLSAMLQAHRRSSRAALAGEWVQRIRHLLHVARWGQQSDASSLLYQSREAWDLLLDSVASLDVTAQTLPYTEFLTILERTARDTIFSSESEDAPVQVMGAYAASGQAFDAVWFLGATDTAWPAAGRPHPLLPLALQREFEMPHSTPSSDSALAHRVTERIIESTREIVFSYAAQSADAIQRGSSLITSFAPLADTMFEQPQQRMALDQIADETWVPLIPTGTTQGGHSTLKQQAACPFQAFLSQRLRVRELRLAGRGLSAIDRGNLIHGVLQDVWSKSMASHTHLHDHADLVAAMRAGILRPMVSAHAAARIRALGADTSERWQRAYLAAEQERTVDLVMDWLEYESGRQPFRVAGVEEGIPVQVGNLALEVRADRIDEVAEGQLLIDYKTGEVTPASWDGTRPKEPQLPLYAAFGNVNQLIGTVFAQVRPAKLAFKGRVADARVNLSEIVKDNDKQIGPYTEEVVEEWRGVLVQLAESFVRGEAMVDPHIYPKTCDYCPLPGVCRVAELRASGQVHSTIDEEEDAQ